MLENIDFQLSLEKKIKGVAILINFLQQFQIIHKFHFSSSLFEKIENLKTNGAKAQSPRQCFFFHRVDGGFDFPRQFPVDHWGVGEWSEQNISGVWTRSPRENFRVLLIILIRKVIKNI